MVSPLRNKKYYATYAPEIRPSFQKHDVAMVLYQSTANAQNTDRRHVSANGQRITWDAAPDRSSARRICLLTRIRSDCQMTTANGATPHFLHGSLTLSPCRRANYMRNHRREMSKTRAKRPVHDTIKHTTILSAISVFIINIQQNWPSYDSH